MIDHLCQKIDRCYQFVVICQDFRIQGAICQKLKIKGQLATLRIIQGAPVQITLYFIMLELMHIVICKLK